MYALGGDKTTYALVEVSDKLHRSERAIKRFKATIAWLERFLPPAVETI